MLAYATKRLLLVVPTLFIVTILVFLSIRLIPGDVVDAMVEELEGIAGQGGGGVLADVTTLDRDAVERLLGLDLPFHVQYGRWMGVLPTPDKQTGESRYMGVLQGNLGERIWTPNTVVEEIRGRLPVSIELGILSLIIGMAIAIPVGIYSAIRQDTATDYIGRTIAIAGLAIPNFWIAIMVMTYPSIWWSWMPPIVYISFFDDPLGNLGMMIIPAMITGTSMAAMTMRMTRAVMLEVLRQDYIRTAWSKGLKEGLVVRRHALKNALIPVVTIVGMQVPILIGGTVIVENVFSLPGVGQLMLDAIQLRDYPVVTGINLMLAIFVMLDNVVVDLTYGFLDPRVQYE